MSAYIQNYGITKTYIKDKNKKIKNEIKWVGDYDGNKANIKLDINDNGNKEFVSMQLDNDQLINILGIQPVEMSLEKRLTNDFLKNTYKPITLEGALTKKKTRKHRKRINHKYKRRKSYKL
jgi:hypothetical protein